jgi:hypothetical protein
MFKYIKIIDSTRIAKLTRNRLRLKLITPHIIKLHIIVSNLLTKNIDRL